MLKRLNLWLVTGAVVLVALAAAACGRDASAPDEAVVAAAAGAVAEGARVSARLHEVLEVPAEGALAPVRHEAAAVAEAEVRGGAAVDAATGATLALAPGRGPAEREVRFTDPDGHSHRLVFGRDGSRGPLASVRYERDGEVVVEASYRWDARDGGFVLRDRVLTLYRGGRVAGRHHRFTQAVDVRGGAPATGEPAVGGEPGPSIPMAAAIACWQQWLSYGVASAELIVAGEIVVLTKGSAASVAALYAAFEGWEAALDQLIACLYR